MDARMSGINTSLEVFSAVSHEVTSKCGDRVVELHEISINECRMRTKALFLHRRYQ